MVTKTIVLYTWAAASWAALLFTPLTPWQVILLVISLALAMAGIGFCVMHDANHGSLTNSARANTIFSYSLDLMGASSFHWRQAHNVLHHSYTNIQKLDVDLEMSFLLCVAPWHRPRAYHRFQHLYIWFLFGIFLPKWWFFDDVRMFIFGRTGPQNFPGPRGATLATALFFKVIFVGWAFVIPALLHPTWKLIPLWILASFVLGNVLGWIFQLAHCVDQADFIEAEPGDRLRASWAEHQVLTTVDFARDNRWVTWYLGGLNFQVEHHLFPRVSHTHYPALAKIVEKTCREHNIRYRATPHFRDAFLDNVRWLRAMGSAR